MKNKKNTNKSIFVSSTFRDMQTERDALRDFVLPRVNEFASKYGRAVEIIDLRWGVDTTAVSEEEQNHKVLRTCLDEIQRSRPYFLGLIGDRYGWTPPQSDMKAALEAANFPLDDLNKSVTALEIEYGVLNTENPPICLFYFRESPDYSLMPEKLKNIYKDNKEDTEKLEKLKEKIRAKHEKDIKTYTVKIQKDRLVVSKEWADGVSKDIIEKLRIEWGEPSDTLPDWKEHEQELQDTFRESRTSHFAGRIAAIEKLASFCLSNDTGNKILMMQGQAGSGKSGLMCKVMEKTEDKCLLLPFICGLSSRSSTTENMLRYFIWVICQKLQLEYDVDTITKYQDLKDRFFELLHFASKKTRVVAIVDALDQFYGSNEARRMLWISGNLPENFKLLCSIIEGPEIEAVKRLGGKVCPVPAISKEDEGEIINSIAQLHHKQLNKKVVEYILNKKTPDGNEAAQNPLYLSLITHNLVMMDRFELDKVQKLMEGGLSYPDALAKFMCERINETPGDAEGAYLVILDRLEKLIGKDFVRAVCGLIAISRSGLRDSDIEGAFKELGLLFNNADFSWLRQMLRGHFSQGDMQQWDFSHQSLRHALRNNRHKELKELNEGIVKHLLNIIKDDNFAAQEIMHHLCYANKPELAAKVIIENYDNYNNELARGLADVYTEHEKGSEFLLSIPDNVESIDKQELWRIVELYDNMIGFLPENTRPFRIELMLKAIAMLEEQEDIKTVQVKARSETNIADLYTEIGDIVKAGKYYQKSLEARKLIHEQTGTIDTLSALSFSYTCMGDHIISSGKIKKAGNFFWESVKAARQVYEQTKTTNALNVLSHAIISYGDYFSLLGIKEEAENYYKEALEINQHIYEQEKTIDALINLSNVYTKMGDYLASIGGIWTTMDETDNYNEKVDQEIFDAMVYYKNALNLDQQIFEKTGTINSLNNLSISYGRIGNLFTLLNETEEAEVFCIKSINAAQQIHEKTGTISSLRNISSSYRRMGNYFTSLEKIVEAGKYYRKALKTSIQIYNKTGTIDDLKSLSEIYEKMITNLTLLEKIDEVIKYQKNYIDAKQKIYEQNEYKQTISENIETIKVLLDLSSSYANIINNLILLDKLEECDEYFEKLNNTMQEILKQNGPSQLGGLATLYGRMGDHLTKSGKIEEAGKYYRKSLDTVMQYIEEGGNLLEELSVSYYNMANHLKSLGKIEEAEEFYKKYIDADKVFNEKLELMNNMFAFYSTSEDNS